MDARVPRSQVQIHGDGVDTVRRLREGVDPDNFRETEEAMDAGADQIERLQREIERLQKEWVSLYGVERMRFEAVQRMSTEIERLRADKDRRR